MTRGNWKLEQPRRELKLHQTSKSWIALYLGNLVSAHTPHWLYQLTTGQCLWSRESEIQESISTFRSAFSHTGHWRLGQCMIPGKVKYETRPASSRSQVAADEYTFVFSGQVGWWRMLTSEKNNGGNQTLQKFSFLFWCNILLSLTSPSLNFQFYSRATLHHPLPVHWPFPRLSWSYLNGWDMQPSCSFCTQWIGFQKQHCKILCNYILQL